MTTADFGAGALGALTYVAFFLLAPDVNWWKRSLATICIGVGVMFYVRGMR